MSRTTEPPACRRNSACMITLLILSICLVAHFLVEDVLLLQVMAVTAENLSTNDLNIYEVEHLDDIAMVADQPISIPHNDRLVVSDLTIHQERQSAFPIHIPPKIV